MREIHSIVLISDLEKYGWKPAGKEEAKQELSVLSDGTVYMFHYACGDGTWELLRKETENIRQQEVDQFFDLVENYISEEPIELDDNAEWMCTIYYEDGSEKSWKGPMIGEAVANGVNLDRWMESHLPFAEVVGFGG